METVSFESLAPEQKRVAIAVDALVSVSSNRYNIRKNHYLMLEYSSTNDVILEDCEVCAIGSTLISMLNLSHTKLNTTTLNHGKLSKLLSYFDKEQLAMIESAFECSDRSNQYANGYWQCVTDEEEGNIEKSIEFGKKFDDVTDRHNAIMRNIIHNNGTFDPVNK